MAVAEYSENEPAGHGKLGKKAYYFWRDILLKKTEAPLPKELTINGKVQTVHTSEVSKIKAQLIDSGAARWIPETKSFHIVMKEGVTQISQGKPAASGSTSAPKRAKPAPGRVALGPSGEIMPLSFETLEAFVKEVRATIDEQSVGVDSQPKHTEAIAKAKSELAKASKPDDLRVKSLELMKAIDSLNSEKATLKIDAVKHFKETADPHPALNHVIAQLTKL